MPSSNQNNRKGPAWLQVDQRASLHAMPRNCPENHSNIETVKHLFQQPGGMGIIKGIGALDLLILLLLLKLFILYNSVNSVLYWALHRVGVGVEVNSRWSFLDVPLTFSRPADHVQDSQPRILLGMVEARSVNV